MENSGNLLFVVTDHPHSIYKINLTSSKIINQRKLLTHNSDLIYNKKRDVLYSPSFNQNQTESFLYEIDGKQLDILRKIPILFVWDIILSENSKELYCALPFESLFSSYVYIFDTTSFKIIDKIRVPLGTRAIAIDEDENLLFAGSAATNLIDLIDLKTKKTIKTYKAGDYSLREIVIDKKRKTFYVSSRNFGLFKGYY